MTSTSSTKENAPPSPETSKSITTNITPKSQRPGQPNDHTIGLYVARYHPNAAHKHWTLFLDGPTASTCVQHQILGPNARTYFEHAKTVGEHPADDPELVQLSFLCNVAAANFDSIAAIAEDMPVYRYRREWDAQVYVLDVIEALESARVIDVPAGQVELYQEFKGVIQGYLEEGNVPPLRGLWDRSLWGVGEW
ncbi:hypothetical protein PHISP_05558 [Aspergillus sp. HF37]|nr:hypothetical protein PHISP_05558 [Aspergillus sp. HF37]